MFDFNSITKEMEAAAVAKFKEHGRGVVMGRFVRGVSEESTWADLINPSLYNESHLKSKMLDVARSINTTCNDAFLGNLEVAFVVVTERDERVEFTNKDIYAFLRAALRYRRDTAAYKKKKARAAELRDFVEKSKTKKEMLKDAREELKKLDDELD